MESEEADDVFSDSITEDATAADILLLFLKEQKKELLRKKNTLTQASYKVIDKVNVAYEQCRQILTEGVSEEELQVFRRVIRQMNDNVNGELE